MIMQLNNGFLLLAVERWVFREFCRSMLEAVASIVVLNF
jgi:hypothetical protein